MGKRGRPKKVGERILGPYYDRNTGRWRVIRFDAAGKKTTGTCATEEEALLSIGQTKDKVAEQTRSVRGLVASYLDARPITDRYSIRVLMAQLSVVLRDRFDLPACRYTPVMAEADWKAFTARRLRRKVRGADGWPVLGADGKPTFGDVAQSPTYCRRVLRTIKACFAHGVVEKWLKTSPWEHVKFTGGKDRKNGYAHLSVDESRAYYDACIAKGDPISVGLALGLLLGTRPSEVFRRRVRDIDEGGTVLVIPEGKTDNAARRLLIPECIRPHVAALKRDKLPTAFLFPQRNHRTIRDASEAISARAGLTRAVPRALRATNATIARVHTTSEIVAAALGHGSDKITKAHYIAPETESAARVTATAAKIGRKHKPE